MDAVITYVNGEDPIWISSYESKVGHSLLAKRYRDWGTLKYLLRGIESFMEYVDKVYLVVACPSQVPSWADTSRLKIVYHEDIIPGEFLPTFNSTAIEMFLHKIQGLSEEYIYFNDDFFPVRKTSASSFFREGKAVMKLSRHFFAPNMYKKQVKASDALAKEAAGASGIGFLRPQHICSPMLKSACEEMFNLKEKEIFSSITALREPFNLNQYLFSDYMYYTGRIIEERRSNTHISLGATSLSRIESFLKNPTTDFVCINDVEMSEEKFELYSKGILSSFDSLLPVPSRFEKQ